MRYVRYFILAAAVFSASISAATTKLLNSHLRPTIEDFIREYGEIPERNPYLSEMSLHFSSLSRAQVANGAKASYPEVLMELLPLAIVKLEKAFPGAKYIGLGRDSAGLADALDAFYLLMAHDKNRVARMNASRGSFSGSSPLTAGFLETNGLDYNTIMVSNGMVIFDTTTFNGNSQLRLLWDEARRGAAAAGLNLKEFSRKFNVMGTRPVDSSGIYINVTANVENYFGAIPNSLHTNLRIFTLDVEPLLYGLEWHGAFGPFYRDDQGRVLADAGTGGQMVHRKSILGMQYEMIQLVRSPAFLKRLAAVAKEFDLDMKRILDPKRLENEKARSTAELERKRKELRQELRALKTLRALEGETQYTQQLETLEFPLSENGAQLWQWFEKASGIVDNANAAFVAFVLEARLRGIVGGRETRQMVRQVLKTEFTEAGETLLRQYFQENPERFRYTYDHIARAGQKKEVFPVSEFLEKIAPDNVKIVRPNTHVQREVREGFSPLIASLGKGKKKGTAVPSCVEILTDQASTIRR